MTVTNETIRDTRVSSQDNLYSRSAYPNPVLHNPVMAKRKRDQIGHRVLARILELRGPDETPGRLTQAQIGQAARLSQQDISLVFGKGRPVIPMDILHAVAGVFGQTLTSLIEAETFTPLGKASARRAQLQAWVAHADEEALEALLTSALATDRSRVGPSSPIDGSGDERSRGRTTVTTGTRAKRGTRRE